MLWYRLFVDVGPLDNKNFIFQLYWKTIKILWQIILHADT